MAMHIISGRLWGGRAGDNWINWVFLWFQQPGFLLPKPSKLYYALLQWIHKWVQQKDKSKYHSCTNTTTKQDEKLFGPQNTKMEHIKKQVYSDFLTVPLNHGAGSTKAKMSKQKHPRNCQEIFNLFFSIHRDALLLIPKKAQLTLPNADLSN